MVEIIDAHHHLWRYSKADYGWISAEMSVLKCDFLLDDLNREMHSAGVDGTVVVQARKSLAETRWLLECADAHPSIRGVVGWVPLVDANVPAVLAELAASAKLKGLRHVVQDEPDGFLLREDFNRGIASMAGTGLVYDILIHERQLPEAAEFVRRHPGQQFVLDHLAKPKIRSGELEPWRSNLFALVSAGNVSCKISGIVTEADWLTWTLDGLRPYLDAALEAFGPECLMAGSDWPVCLLASGYAHWWNTLRQWLDGMSTGDRELILGGNAQRVYGLD